MRSPSVYSPRLRKGNRLRGVAIASIGVGAILVFAAVARWPVLHEGLWADECLSVWLVRSRGVARLLHDIRVADYSPPLFHAMLFAWTRLFGIGEAALKAFPFVSGIAVIAAAGLAAGEMFGPSGSVLAAALVANDRLSIEMASEVRPYALSELLALLSLFALFRLQRRVRDGGSTRAASVALTSALVLLAYSHYAGTLAVAAIGAASLVGLAIGKEREFWRKAAAAVAVAGVAFLPWIPTFVRQLGVGTPWAEVMNPALRLSRLGMRTRMFLPLVDDGRLAGSWIGVAIAVGLVLTSRDSRRVLRSRAAALAICLGFGLAVFGVLGYVGPSVRYLTLGAAFTCLAIAGVVSAAVETESPRAGGMGRFAVGVVIAGSFLGRLWQYDDIWSRARIGPPKSGVRPAVEYLRLVPSDLLLADPDTLSPSLWYYTKGRIPIHGFPRWDDPLLPAYASYERDWNDPGAARRDLTRLESSVAPRSTRRVVLFFSVADTQPSYRVAKAFEDLLAARFRVTEARWFNGRPEGVHVTVIDPTRSPDGRPRVPGDEAGR